MFGFSFFVAWAFGQNADSLAAAAQADSLELAAQAYSFGGASDKALEFVHFGFSEKNRPLQEMYGALILLPNGQPPTFISLFEEKQLDSLLKSSGDRKADYVNSLYSLADRGAVVVARPQKTLYELLWKPLEKAFAGASTVYFSPSGLLHRLNLGAIPLGDDQVPDKQTSLLMTTFYRKWLKDEMAIPEAFRAAQKELRDAGLDPYQWAGFVLVE